MAWLSVGCAHATFTPRIQSFGASGPQAPMVEAAASFEADDLRNVQVSFGELPPGVALEDGAIVVNNPRYELLANVTTSYDIGEAVLGSLGFAFYRHETRGLTAFCDAQVPLVWVSLGVWMVSPLHWPCMIAESNAVAAQDRRRERILDALVRGTAGAGGNLLVVTSLGDIRVVTVYGGYATSGTMHVVTGEGFALLDKQAAPSDP